MDRRLVLLSVAERQHGQEGQQGAANPHQASSNNGFRVTNERMFTTSQPAPATDGGDKGAAFGVSRQTNQAPSLEEVRAAIVIPRRAIYLSDWVQAWFAGAARWTLGVDRSQIMAGWVEEAALDYRSGLPADFATRMRRPHAAASASYLREARVQAWAKATYDASYAIFQWVLENRHRSGCSATTVALWQKRQRTHRQSGPTTTTTSQMVLRSARSGSS